MVRYNQRYFTGDVTKRLREINIIQLHKECVRELVSKKEPSGEDKVFCCHNCEENFTIVNIIKHEDHEEILCNDCFHDLVDDRLNDILNKIEK